VAGVKSLYIPCIILETVVLIVWSNSKQVGDNTATTSKTVVEFPIVIASPTKEKVDAQPVLYPIRFFVFAVAETVPPK
jgi:hypothetical protein